MDQIIILESDLDQFRKRKPTLEQTPLSQETGNPSFPPQHTEEKEAKSNECGSSTRNISLKDSDYATSAVSAIFILTESL
jgi:hypothetical protein